ncbi:MAG: ABC transporter ATP-binding protein [Candidatus Tectomicrobia bacterium]|nr:ABC transporter ATP-binding protein [Candidatus Tectomicrobia bacterium]
MTYIIKLAHISKSFRGRGWRIEALKDVSLEVQKEEFVTIIGPSGSGKTTLLDIIGGFLPPDSGEVEISGRKVEGIPREIGYIFQSPTLMPWRTVLENVALPLELNGSKKETIVQDALNALSSVNLLKFKDEYPSALSGGLKQRVAIARMLAYDPDILLMDEPFSSLDAITRGSMNLLLLRVWEKSKKTVIFVTHSIDEAVLLSDKVYLLSGHPGEIRGEFLIDLPRPRSTQTPDLPQFHGIASKIHQALRDEFEPL